MSQLVRKHGGIQVWAALSDGDTREHIRHFWWFKQNAELFKQEDDVLQELIVFTPEELEAREQEVWNARESYLIRSDIHPSQQFKHWRGIQGK